MMILRSLEPVLVESLRQFPVVTLLGARQTGKTTLAKNLARKVPAKAVYLDLERPSDLAKFEQPELYLEQHVRELVILDEIQRAPRLFSLLRALVDAERRPGRFLLLGSASPDLRRESSESLAGRMITHELAPLTIREVSEASGRQTSLWARGGFPESLLAPSDAASFRWREAFIQTWLERDLPLLGLKLSPSLLRRFWQMIAHLHGQIWNASRVAGGLGVTAPTATRYLDLLQETFMVRRLAPYHVNLGKRLVKAPKIYLRDSGLLHALLNIQSLDELQGHPSLGASWEGWVIEQILSELPSRWQPSFYRTHSGAEIDLLIEIPGSRAPLAVEIKYSSTPSLSRGFWSAMEDLNPSRAFVVAPVRERYRLDKRVEVIPVAELPVLIGEWIARS